MYMGICLALTLEFYLNSDEAVTRTCIKTSKSLEHVRVMISTKSCTYACVSFGNLHLFMCK